MLKNTIKIALLALTVAGVASSCKKKDDDSPAVQLRTKISADLATDTTTYARLFVDEKGASTVDVTEGNALLVFFADTLIPYARKAASDDITVAGLKQKYNNTNAAGNSVRSLTASSRANSAEADAIRADIEDLFELQVEAGKSRSNKTASKGQAGMLGTYLVNEGGLEGVQLIAKGLIGTFQMDYIGNVLLGSGLDADNSKPVAGKTYTALEHNWDLAYSTFTKKSYYGKDAKLTPGTSGASSGETQLGSYVWEYNQDAFKQLNKAFVKGRIAIVNNDKTELKAQADFIRRAFEKAVAQAALGYLKKWKDAGTNTAVAAHAIGEGAGFIYSLRVANLNGGSDKFSDDVLDGLLGSEGAFWDITNDKINAAGDAIAKQFGVTRPW